MSIVPVIHVSSKWKEVLGFDNSFSRPSKTHKTVKQIPQHNPYQLTSSNSATYTTPNTSTGASIRTTTTINAIPVPPSSQPLSYPRFPRDTVFFHRQNEILISAPLTASSSKSSSASLTPRPLFYVTLSANNLSHTSRPDIILHAGADKASMAVCFVKNYPSSPFTLMTLCPPPTKPISANFSSEDITALPVSPIVQTDHIKSTSMYSAAYLPCQKTKDSASPHGTPLSRFRVKRLIHIFDPISSSYKYIFLYAGENFEWRRAKSKTYQKSRCHNGPSGCISGGMKLVRASTGEVLAVHDRVTSSRCWETEANTATSSLKFRRTKSMDEFDNEFDIFVVVSLVSIVQKEEREWCQSYGCS